MAPAEAGACETSPLSSQRGTCSGRKSRARECWLMATRRGSSTAGSPLQNEPLHHHGGALARLGDRQVPPRYCTRRAIMMAPVFCCRAPGSADGERCLGVGGHQERTVVGSCFVLRCLRQAPIGSSVSASLRCRNQVSPIKVTPPLTARPRQPQHLPTRRIGATGGCATLVELGGIEPPSSTHLRSRPGPRPTRPFPLRADQSPGE